jgi:hypothetical protein
MFLANKTAVNFASMGKPQENHCAPEDTGFYTVLRKKLHMSIVHRDRVLMARVVNALIPIDRIAGQPASREKAALVDNSCGDGSADGESESSGKRYTLTGVFRPPLYWCC